MFSPAASSRGAGQGYPIGSPLRPRRGRILYDNGNTGPGASVAEIARAAAIPARIRVGEGFLPPAGVAEPPGPDSKANFLGSGAEYNLEKDIGGDLSIAKLKKSVKSADYFGAGVGEGIDKIYKHAVTTKDLLRFAEGIERVVRPAIESNYPGGTFMDFLLDPDYEPVLTVGRSYFPGPTETWTAFTASAESMERFNSRKAVLRQHVADICLAFSEPTYWRECAESVADRSDGQLMIRKWMGLFHDESLMSVTSRADKLCRREFMIQGAEDPSHKIQTVVSEWSSIRLTSFGMAQYSPSWLAKTLLNMVLYNQHYSIWRQSGGSNRILHETNPSIMQSIIIDVWADSHTEWERAEKKARGGNGKGGGRHEKKARIGAGPNGDSGASGSRDMSTIECYKCGKMGHYARDCRGGKGGGKGGAKKGKGGGKGGNGGKARASAVAAAKAKGRTSWLTPPCEYRGCEGDKKTHATVDCPTKIAADKRSREAREAREAAANDSGNAKDKKGKGAKVSILNTTKDSESDSDSDQ